MKKRFQQSDFWCDFKCAHGWKKVSFGDVNILVRTFKKAFISFSFAYIPLAPEKNEGEDDGSYIARVGKLSSKIKGLLPKNTLCLRYDLPLDFSTCQERDSFVKNLPLLSTN